MNLIGIITIILLCILEGAEIDLFVPSFPQIQKVFDISPVIVELTLSMNFMAYCLTSLVIGALGDRYGRKSVMLCTLIIFVLGSVICVVANSYYLIVIGRILQGIGAAGPAILCYVIIADKFSGNNQMKLVGILNGVVTFAAAFAPVVGSYINLYFGWRGTFAALLIIGVLCLIMLYYFLTNDRNNFQTSNYIGLFSGYRNILCTHKLRAFIICMSFLFTPYWVFIGLAPILFMEEFGLSLQKFGFYQGMITLSFSLFSILSGYAIKLLGQKMMLIISFWICVIGGLFIIFLGIINSTSAVWITSSMVFFAIGVVAPASILYYKALDILSLEKSKVAAIILAIRLALTAVGLEVAGYFYHGDFQSISIVLCVSIIIGIYYFYKLFQKKWI